MMQTLKSNNVTFVNPHEVPICQEKGIPVLDVRTVEQYEKVGLLSAARFHEHTQICEHLQWSFAIISHTGYITAGIHPRLNKHPSIPAYRRLGCL